MTYPRVTGEYIPFTCTVGEDLTQAVVEFAFYNSTTEIIKVPTVVGNVASLALTPRMKRRHLVSITFEWRVSSERNQTV